MTVIPLDVFGSGSSILSGAAERRCFPTRAMISLYQTAKFACEEAGVSVWLSVEGDHPFEGLAELSDWLRLEPELRGLISPAPTVPGPGELGGPADALVVAVGSGGAISVLAASLRAFLVQPRRSDVRIVLGTPDGRRVEIDAKRVRDVEALVRETLGQAE